jgi:broad specificity phosphatase PhoE
MMERLKPVIDLLKTTDAVKILVVTHGGTISVLNRILTGIQGLVGVYKYGSNCHISYYNYNKKNNKFIMRVQPNTSHFAIYQKDYSTNKK